LTILVLTYYPITQNSSKKELRIKPHACGDTEGMQEFSLLQFIIAGFSKALEPILIDNKAIKQLLKELEMSLTAKLQELSSKTDSLVGTVNTEKQEVADKLTALATEIDALKKTISDLQETIDSSNSEQEALSALVDQQIAKVDAAAADISSIIS
jgi:chromosome segregation ATPase